MTHPRVSRRNQRGAEEVTGLRLLFWFCLLSVGALSGCGFERQGSLGEEPDSGLPRLGAAGEIAEMLRASADSWNRGDLEGFLDDYWRSEELTFSGGGGVTRGWEDVRTRYLTSYWAPGAVRDSLRFEDIDVTKLGEDHALALGKYVLFRPEEAGAVSATGYFSLVLGKLEGRWKILHDHTSAAPGQEGLEEEGS